MIAFELLAEDAVLVVKNAALNGFTNVTVLQAGISVSDGEHEVVTSEVTSWDRLTFVPTAPGCQADKIVVPVRTLDSLLEHRHVRAPTPIKIDVDGAQDDVLAGAGRYPERLGPLLVTELHGTSDRVAVLLDAPNYGQVVLGADQDIREASWNAHVVAAPQGDRRLVRHCADLAWLPVTGR